MTRDTSTYCRSFSSGAVTTCFYHLGLSRLRFEHPTFRLRGQRCNPLRHLRGWKTESLYKVEVQEAILLVKIKLLWCDAIEGLKVFFNLYAVTFFKSTDILDLMSLWSSISGDLKKVFDGFYKMKKVFFKQSYIRLSWLE